jgi:hypothetical protein
MIHHFCPGFELLPFMEASIDDSWGQVRDMPMAGKLKFFTVGENQYGSAAVHPMEREPMIFN